MTSKQPHKKHGMDLTAEYIAQTIEAAKRGDIEAAEDALSLFRGAVDARTIDGTTPEYRSLAEYVAECLWRYESGATIGEAMGVERKRSRGQPKGTKKVNESSYAAFIILLTPIDATTWFRRQGKAQNCGTRGRRIWKEFSIEAYAGYHLRRVQTIARV